MMISQRLIPSLAASVLNTLLNKEAWARQLLQAHAYQSFSIELASWCLCFRVTSEGLCELVYDDLTPDVSIEIKTENIHALLQTQTAERMKAVRLQGDASFVHTLGDVFKNLRWDVEEDLARYLGDIPAMLLLRALREAINTGKQRWESLRDTLVDYWVFEDEQLLSTVQIEDWVEDVRSLRDDVERLQKRVNWLLSQRQSLLTQAKD